MQSSNVRPGLKQYRTIVLVCLFFSQNQNSAGSLGAQCWHDFTSGVPSEFSFSKASTTTPEKGGEDKKTAPKKEGSEGKIEKSSENDKGAVNGVILWPEL